MINGVKGVHYIGEYKPVKVMRNNVMLAGYVSSEKSSETLEWQDTYIDTIFSAIVQGKSEQTGTPSPSTPISILSAGGNLKSRNADNSLSSTIVMPAVRSLPSGAKDTLEYRGGGLWRYAQNVGHKVFDGTGAWQISSNEYDITTLRFYIRPDGITSNSPAYASHFLYKAITVVVDSDTEGCGVSASPYLNIRVLKSRLPDYSDSMTATQKISAFKAWLAAQNTAGTPVIVDYQLTTPIVTDLTLGDLKTYPHYTKLEQDGTVKATITASALVSD
jgi:hypothetical protein